MRTGQPSTKDVRRLPIALFRKYVNIIGDVTRIMYVNIILLLAQTKTKTAPGQPNTRVSPEASNMISPPSRTPRALYGFTNSAVELVCTELCRASEDSSTP